MAEMKTNAQIANGIVNVWGLNDVNDPHAGDALRGRIEAALEASATELVDEDLAAMMERCEKATEGPWGYDLNGYVAIIDEDEWGSTVAKVDTRFACSREDGEFIAHAREDLPRVIKELVATRAENERLRKLDAQSRASGCWCDEYGHPCKACSDKQELAARLAKAEAERDELRANNMRSFIAEIKSRLLPEEAEQFQVLLTEAANEWMREVLANG